MSKRNQFKTDKLSRFLIYILGHNPSEFGLLPDSEGFFSTKDLLQAIREESGWGFVRQGNINEVLVGPDHVQFQFDEKRIRVRDRHWKLDLESPVETVPKILFTGVRRKAHPVVLEKGLRNREERYYMLSDNSEMAERIGKRRDHKPVIIEITARTALERGISFYPFGELFLCREIPSTFIIGPPVPKAEQKEREKKIKEKSEPAPDFTPGTFTLRVERDMDRARRSRGKKEKGWKEEARKHRRRKK